MIKYFIGPMSKNIVDSILEFTSETGVQIGLIPSRRQVEWSGGYVNNWTTGQFSSYAKPLTLVRDHGGPGQGYTEDDGYKSLEEDCKYLNIIHIDPWKKYPEYPQGLKWTVDMIKFCHSKNPNICYEVGTEESIRRFTDVELRKFLKDLSLTLTEDLFGKINYLVIQTGTSLKGTNNTGQYDKDRLLKMVAVARDYKLLSKEHNGDYIPTSLIREKMSLGLDCINIAPEVGLIETQTYLQNIKDDEILENFWKVCFESRRWEKWVDASFDPFTQKIDLINICGHYVLSDDKFISLVKNKLPDIDSIVKENVKSKLKELTLNG